MADRTTDSLVTTDWLAEHLDAPDVKVVDASWYLPAMNRDARQEYDDQHIPGAVFFDIDEIADTSSSLPHMLPPPEKFSVRVRNLGLGDGNRIVVYDGAGIFSAPRAWWMFRAFGHREVAVLDGGLPKWLKEGRLVENTPPVPRARHFTARFNNMLVRDIDQIRGIVSSGREQIVDARSPGRFAGSEPEPRRGLRSGHIPGSLNLPFGDLIDPGTGTMLPEDRLRQAFDTAGVDLRQPVTASCGSGISACTIALALDLLGHRDVAVYDGSWTEWGGRDDTAIEP